MPHLQFETTADPTDEQKRGFADAITELYAEHMETGTGHVAVTISDLEDAAFSLGRLEAGDDALMLNADIREGRTFEQQRAFVLAAFKEANERWGVPTENTYAVITEHTGQEFHEYDRVLSSWDDLEAEEGA